MPAAAPVAGAQQRVAFVCPPGAPLRQIRDVLVREVVARHHRVLVVAPEFRDDDVRGLDAIGAEHALCAPDANGLKLFSDWKAIGGLKTGAHCLVAAAGRRMRRQDDGLRRAGGEKRRGRPRRARRRRAARASLQRRARRRRDAGLALRAGAACRRRSRLPQSRRSRAAEEAGSRTEGLPVAIVPGAGVETESRPAAAAAGDRSGPRVSHDRQPRSAPWRHGILRGGDGAAPALADLALPARRSCRRRAQVAINAAELARHPDVEYLGVAIDIPSCCKQCHVFVYPSYAEGMPQPLLEAMAAGRPIVTTNIPGCRETVDERVNGCLVAPRDAEALADAMESFLRRPDLIPAMARASRAKAERFAIPPRRSSAR